MRVWLLSCVVLLCLSDASFSGQAETSDLQIQLAGDTEREKEVAEVLSGLWKAYDLRKWTFTRIIRIEAGTIPHSHPVLTINTRHLNGRNQLLALFLHEQIHWFLADPDNKSRLEDAITALQEMYPNPPTYESGGAANTRSTYLHLILNWLEFDALSQILGPSKARSVLEGKDVYEWIYLTVEEENSRLQRLISQNGLKISNDYD